MLEFLEKIMYDIFMNKKSVIVEKKVKLLDLLCGQGFSYNYACKLLRNKDVKVNGQRVKENMEVLPSSEVTVFFQDDALSPKFEIVYEDENIYCINKRSGIEVEGADGLEGMIKGARAVHRLDRNSEGLLLMAKNKIAEQELKEGIKNRFFTKKYLAEVVGKTNFDGKVQKAYLLKDSEKGKVKIFQNQVKGSLEILTAFKTIKSSATSSIVECDLITGRTHQIRAHLAYLGHPIIGDGKYGKNEENRKFKEKSQKLHCFYIKIDKLSQKLQYLNGKEFVCYPDWFKSKNNQNN